MIHEIKNVLVLQQNILQPCSPYIFFTYEIYVMLL